MFELGNTSHIYWCQGSIVTHIRVRESLSWMFVSWTVCHNVCVRDSLSRMFVSGTVCHGRLCQ